MENKHPFHAITIPRRRNVQSLLSITRNSNKNKQKIRNKPKWKLHELTVNKTATILFSICRKLTAQNKLEILVQNSWVVGVFVGQGLGKCVEAVAPPIAKHCCP